MAKLVQKKSDIEQYHLHKGQPERLQFEIYALQEYLTKNTSHTEKPHIHSFYQIIWFTEGNGKHFVDFNAYEASPNKMFFISKNQIHYFDACKNYEGVIVHFNESFLMDSESDIDIFLKYNIFNDFESEPVFTIPSAAVENLMLLVANLKNEIANPNDFAHKDFLKHLLKLFLISIQRLGRKNSGNSALTNQNQLTLLKFKQLLELNFRNIHTVKAYANMLNISTKTLTNHTTEVAFKAPLSLINDRIVLEAKRLLSHSHLNISEIGFQLGYEDPSYFVKFFKRQTGKSPSDFRKVIS